MQKITGQHVSEKNAYLKDLDTLIPFLSLEMVYEDYRTKINRARDSSFPQTPMTKVLPFLSVYV